VVLQGALLVGRLELRLGGIWRHPQDIVELLVFDHGRDCRGRVGGVEGLVGFVEVRVFEGQDSFRAKLLFATGERVSRTRRLRQVQRFCACRTRVVAAASLGGKARPG
jgi:hypothetical protein